MLTYYTNLQKFSFASVPSVNQGGRGNELP